MALSRRKLMLNGAALLGAPAFSALPAFAQDSTKDKEWKHGLSLFGELKYPAGFKSFDYVNASAPKGGSARQIAFGTTKMKSSPVM